MENKYRKVIELIVIIGILAGMWWILASDDSYNNYEDELEFEESGRLLLW